MKDYPFKAYNNETYPMASLWRAAIGLQAVDDLSVSDYLIALARRNIVGEISILKVNELLEDYYLDSSDDSRTSEADRVSSRIVSLLSVSSFSFSVDEYLKIHKDLFSGVYSHAGKIRTSNISKKEDVLGGESVLYGFAGELRATLEYDLSQEKKFSYRNLSKDEEIKHLAKFLSMLWQIHPFREGNTRTTALFFIKYVRTLGFNPILEIFSDNSSYFRNALVRAVYCDYEGTIDKDPSYLELFLRNLLLGEKNDLQVSTMHVSGH